MMTGSQINLRQYERSLKRARDKIIELGWHLIPIPKGQAGSKELRTARANWCHYNFGTIALKQNSDMEFEIIAERDWIAFVEENGENHFYFKNYDDAVAFKLYRS